MYELIYGDVFSKTCDLIILPCNNLGGVTGMVRQQLEINHISYTQEAVSPGKVRFVEAPKCDKANIICFAVSINVSTIKSDIKYIKHICGEIKEFCIEHKIKYVNTPLLGTGLGGLSATYVFEVFKTYFEYEKNVYLRIFIISKSIYDELSNCLNKSQSENEVIDSYETSQYDQIFQLLTNGKLYKYDYDVTLSFSGEDRNYVEKIAINLRKRGIKVFYDKFETANLWGKDLYQYLSHVYRDKARFCVVFISQSYKDKAWTKLELRNAQNRAFNENEEYILPVFLEDIELDGLNDTIGYIKSCEYSYNEICDFIIKKINSI